MRKCQGKKNRGICGERIARGAGNQKSRMRASKNFIQRNDGFTCKNCGKEVAPLKKSCRNHCQNCLYSLHVDLETPGDRANSCLGLMKPIQIDYSGKKGFILIHQCLKCNHIAKNKVAPDDERKTVIKVMKNES